MVKQKGEKHSVKLYVEGGGHDQLDIKLRQGFHEFLKESGVKNMPRIVAGHSRSEAFRSFRETISNECAILLVDSEAPLDPENEAGDQTIWKPWAHLKTRKGDGWDKPEAAKDSHCHLMVQCMESWLLCDPTNLANFFGRGFRRNRLPAAGTNLERVAKDRIYQHLREATRSCAKGPYDKGKHSFELLALLDPDHVTAASPWAARFVDVVKRLMDGEDPTS